MIILDTNVISEPLKANASPLVQKWLDQQTAELLYLTSVNLAELMLGVAILPEGERKKKLDIRLMTLVIRLFQTRTLSFNKDAAMIYARLISHARSNGRSISVADGQIAAIAAVHGFTVATRDTAPFIAMGIPVINPWES